MSAHIRRREYMPHIGGGYMSNHRAEWGTGISLANFNPSIVGGKINGRRYPIQPWARRKYTYKRDRGGGDAETRRKNETQPVVSTVGTAPTPHNNTSRQNAQKLYESIKSHFGTT